DVPEFFEPVHLGQDLVEHIVDHVRIAACSPGRCKGIDLVKEYDRWRDLPGFLKDFPDRPLTLAHPLGEELRPPDRNEVRPALACYGLCDQGLAGTGRPVEEDTPGGHYAEVLEFLAVGERELDRFADLCLGRVETP